MRERDESQLDGCRYPPIYLLPGHVSVSGDGGSAEEFVGVIQRGGGLARQPDQRLRSTGRAHGHGVHAHTQLQQRSGVLEGVWTTYVLLAHQ